MRSSSTFEKNIDEQQFAACGAIGAQKTGAAGAARTAVAERTI
jgi:hypothetical protein